MTTFGIAFYQSNLSTKETIQWRMDPDPNGTEYDQKGRIIQIRKS